MDLAIVCSDLRKGYRGREVLRGVSFEVLPGRVVGLLGPNGAGKTTTLRILTTVIKADRGTATVNGLDVTRNPLSVRRCIAVVQQFNWLNHYLSVEDNVLTYLMLHEMPWATARRKTAWALEVFGLAEFRRMRCEQLSGGLRRRVQIARALAVPAVCYFLDEPSTGLDPKARREFWQLLNGLLGELRATVFLNTHSMEEVTALCNDVILLDQGEVRAQGSVSGLMREAGRSRVRVELEFPPGAVDAEMVELGVSVDTEGRSVTLLMKPDPDLLPQALLVLTRAGNSIRSIEAVPPTFEDVYLRLIGQAEDRRGGDGG